MSWNGVEWMTMGISYIRRRRRRHCSVSDSDKPIPLLVPGRIYSTDQLHAEPPNTTENDWLKWFGNGRVNSSRATTNDGCVGEWHNPEEIIAEYSIWFSFPFNFVICTDELDSTVFHTVDDAYQNENLRCANLR